MFYDKKPRCYAKDNRTAHLTARSDKSVAYVTSNKRLYSTFCTVEANYWQTRSIARPLCDLLYFSCVHLCSEAGRHELFNGSRLLFLWRLRRSFVMRQPAMSVRRRISPKPAENGLPTAYDFQFRLHCFALLLSFTFALGLRVVRLTVLKVIHLMQMPRPSPAR